MTTRTIRKSRTVARIASVQLFPKRKQFKVKLVSSILEHIEIKRNVQNIHNTN